MQSVDGDSVQRGVVEDDDGVGVEGEALQGEEAVVGLDDDVGCFVLVGKHRVRLHQFLAVPIVERFQEVGAHAGAGASRDGVAQHEALEGIRSVSLPVDHVHDLLLHALRLRVAARPVVTGAAARVGDVHILLVVEVAVFRVLNGVDDSRLEVEEQRPWDVVLVVSLVEEDVLAIARVAVGGVLL